MENMKYDYLIVGAGLYGATFAHFATQQGKRCLVIDKRPHTGGNIYCSEVEGINVHAKHRKPDQSNPQGGIDRKPAPMHISNVAVADKDGKPTRVRFEDRDGKKVRVAVKSGEVL